METDRAADINRLIGIYQAWSRDFLRLTEHVRRVRRLTVHFVRDPELARRVATQPWAETDTIVLCAFRTVATHVPVLEANIDKEPGAPAADPGLVAAFNEAAAAAGGDPLPEPAPVAPIDFVAVAARHAARARRRAPPPRFIAAPHPPHGPPTTERSAPSVGAVD